MGNFEENNYAPVTTLHKFDVSKQFAWNLNGVCKCKFMQDSVGNPTDTGVDASSQWLSIAEYVFSFSSINLLALSSIAHNANCIFVIRLQFHFILCDVTSFNMTQSLIYQFKLYNIFMMGNININVFG